MSFICSVFYQRLLYFFCSILHNNYCCLLYYSPHSGIISRVPQVGYVEVSARRSTNVEKAFFDLVRAIRKLRYPELETASSTGKRGQTGRSKCVVL